MKEFVVTGPADQPPYEIFKLEDNTVTYITLKDGDAGNRIESWKRYFRSTSWDRHLLEDGSPLGALFSGAYMHTIQGQLDETGQLKYEDELEKMNQQGPIQTTTFEF